MQKSGRGVWCLENVWKGLEPAVWGMLTVAWENWEVIKATNKWISPIPDDLSPWKGSRYNTPNRQCRFMMPLADSKPAADRSLGHAVCLRCHESSGGVGCLNANRNNLGQNGFRNYKTNSTTAENKTVFQSPYTPNHHYYPNLVSFQRTNDCEFSLKSKLFDANPWGCMYVWILFYSTGG